MLVYHIRPMGYTEIEGRRIYGKYFSYGSFGPTDVPRSFYKKHKDKLEEAEYTTVWLEEKFNMKFPDVRFKITEMYKLDFNKLVEVAQKIGIDYIPGRKPTDSQKRALRRSVISHISD